MTAEIVIMNKQAIALASDSAVTMTHEMGEKIKTSANKLFALSKYHPVGVMIYNNADLMGIPWETIIKIYRNKIDKKAFDSLKEYADNFIAFLDNGNPFFSDSVQKEYLYFSMYGYFDFIKEQIFEYLEFFLSKEKYGETIEKVMYEVFQELPISKIHSDQLKEIGASLFSKFPDSI